MVQATICMPWGGGDDDTLALGDAVGPQGAADCETEKVQAKIRGRRAAMQHLEHAPTEMVISRLCACVSALMYQLRVAGDLVDPAARKKHSASLRGAIEVILGGGLTDEAWEQAHWACDTRGSA